MSNPERIEQVITIGILQENWPESGLQLADVVLNSMTSFKNPSLIMTIQPHSLSPTESCVRSSSPAGLGGREGGREGALCVKCIVIAGLW